MRSISDILRLSTAVLLLLWTASFPILAQDAKEETKDDKKEDVTVVESITVTGSRIRRNPLNEPPPLWNSR